MTVFARTRLYSKFVIFLKWFCLCALAITLVFILFEYSKPEHSTNLKLQVADKQDVQLDDKSQKIVHPRFYGVNAKKESYNIVAKEAVEVAEKEVILTSPNAHMSDNAGSDMELIAKKALWHNGSRNLELEDEVELKYSDYKIKAKEITLDVNNSFATSDENVDITGPLGELSATGFEVLYDQKIIRFRSNVRMIVKPNN